MAYGRYHTYYSSLPYSLLTLSTERASREREENKEEESQIITNSSEKKRAKKGEERSSQQADVIHQLLLLFAAVLTWTCQSPHTAPHTKHLEEEKNKRPITTNSRGDRYIRYVR
jgi:hypothetical protein